METISKATVKAKILELYRKELEYLPGDNSHIPVFDEPDVLIAAADDKVIKNLKTVIGSFHWSPDEALKMAFPDASMPAASVISWCLPTSETVRKTNRNESYYPSTEWAWTRTFGENMSDRMKTGLSAWLTEKGFPSTAPGISPDFGFIQESPVGIASQWSERHHAWAAGHGTFGISGGLITRHGIAHRLGSVVTTLPLSADQREYGDAPFAWCTNCGACIKRCPVGSIGKTHAERNKNLCDRHDMKRIAAQQGIRYNWEGIYGCGLCQTGVPCEFKKP